MKSALFLGAGASHFVSHPTTKELKDELIKAVQSQIRGNEQQLMLDILTNDKLDDIEKIYDCIDPIIELQNYCSKHIVHKIQYTYNITSNYSIIYNTFLQLKKIIRKTILNVFDTDSNSDDIKTVYNKIWSTMKKHGSSTFDIITTNYDRVIERYCDEKWHLVTGFSPQVNLQPSYWDDTWTLDTTKLNLCLVKLHGSITWQKKANQIIQASVVGDRTQNNDIMIFPTLGEKSYEKKPFNALIGKFKTILNNINVLIVIGFSYRDPEINMLIETKIKEGLQVISISPNSNQIEKITSAKVDEVKIGENVIKKYGNNIFVCEKEFNPITIDDICEFLEIIYKFIEQKDVKN